MRKILVVCLVIFSSASVLPQSPSDPAWRYIASSSDGTDVYYILRTISGDMRVAFLKRQPPPESNEETTVTLKRFNCSEGSARTLRIITYLGNKTIDDDSYEDLEWTFFPAGTIGESQLDAVCGPRKREWLYIDSTKDKEHYFVRLAAGGGENTVRRWVKSVLKNETKSISLMEFDCAAGKTRDLQRTAYDAAETSTITKPSSWTFVVPDSIGESLLKSACRKQSPNRAR